MASSSVRSGSQRVGEQLRAGTSVDRVYQDLRTAIIDGRYSPGSPLRLHQLTSTFGVSLIPIREALRRLEAERLVDTVPNKGARVAGISDNDVLDAYSLRVLLETEALKRAWARLDPPLIRQLRGIREEMVGQLGRNQRKVYELHRRLHFEIYERADSPWLLYLIEILWSHTERYRRLAARLNAFLDEPDDLHGHILDMIEGGDLEGAAAELQKDLERTARLVVGAHQKGRVT